MEVERIPPTPGDGNGDSRASVFTGGQSGAQSQHSGSDRACGCGKLVKGEERLRGRVGPGREATASVLGSAAGEMWPGRGQVHTKGRPGACAAGCSLHGDPEAHPRAPTCGKEVTTVAP